MVDPDPRYPKRASESLEHHQRRKPRVTRAEVLFDIGRVDQLDPDGLRRLVRSINRYLGEADAGDDGCW